MPVDTRHTKVSVQSFLDSVFALCKVRNEDTLNRVLCHNLNRPRHFAAQLLRQCVCVFEILDSYMATVIPSLSPLV
jgi:hypothetical protein